MLDWVVWIASWALVLSGCAFIVSGSIGLVRLPDLYTRLHSASVTDTGGAILLAAGLFLQAVFTFGNPIAAVKVILILFFTLFTAPTASHALAKTALLAGRVPLDAHGRPILDSPEMASRLARSRPSPDAGAVPDSVAARPPGAANTRGGRGT